LHGSTDQSSRRDSRQQHIFSHLITATSAHFAYIRLLSNRCTWPYIRPPTHTATKGPTPLSTANLRSTRRRPESSRVRHWCISSVRRRHAAITRDKDGGPVITGEAGGAALLSPGREGNASRIHHLESDAPMPKALVVSHTATPSQNTYAAS
jgi:hypothetical protein